MTSTQDRHLGAPGTAPRPPDPPPLAGDAAPAGEGATASHLSDQAERGAWTLVWLGVLGSGLGAWSTWTESSTMSVLAPLIALAGTVGLVACWLVRTPRGRRFQWLTLAAVVVSVVATQYGPIHTRRYYTTDAAALDHVATLALVHGHNPYTASMAGAGSLLDVPARFWTYTATGGFVHDVSYPAGSFLVYALAPLLGFHHQFVDWVDLGAWLVTGVLVFAALPRRLRWLAALLVLTPLFVGIFGSGGTDAPFLPFLVLAVWRWDRYGGPRRDGLARWSGPVALGVACAIKQMPWFCVPFLVTGVVLEARRQGRRPVRLGVRYLATVAAVFAVLNLPFALAAPGPWWHGSLTPLVQPLVADGQGLVTLATQGVVSGVDLTVLSACGALVFVAVLCAFVAGYPRTKRVWLLLVPLAMFASARSLSSYLVDLVPAALVAALTVAGTGGRPSPGGRGSLVASLGAAVRTPWRRWAAAGCALSAVGAVVAAVVAFTSVPLSVAVRSVHTGPAGSRFYAVTVTVDNHTGSPQVPHVLVDMGSHPSGFWLPRHGPLLAVPPHGRRTYTLSPPTVTYTALRGAGWVVQAYTADPRALSTSAVQVGTRPPPQP